MLTTPLSHQYMWVSRRGFAPFWMGGCAYTAGSDVLVKGSTVGCEVGCAKNLFDMCKPVFVLWPNLRMQEQYVKDKDFLLAAVEAAGLPRDAAAAQMDAISRGEQLVQQEEGKYPGVHGVPHFVINGR